MLMQRRRRMILLAAILVSTLAWIIVKAWPSLVPVLLPPQQTAPSSVEVARDALAPLPTKGRAPKTGYKLSNFGDG